jgi:hypothetical protein
MADCPAFHGAGYRRRARTAVTIRNHWDIDEEEKGVRVHFSLKKNTLTPFFASFFCLTPFGTSRLLKKMHSDPYFACLGS